MEDLYIQELQPQVSIEELLLEENKKELLVNFIKEHKHAKHLIKLGLPVSNTLLLHGHTGCGKTFTTRILASELKMHLLIVNLSNIVLSNFGDIVKFIDIIISISANIVALLF